MDNAAAMDAGTARKSRRPQPVPASTPARPSAPQLRYLAHGLDQPGGKLPLFDEFGQEISTQTIRSCIEKGWAEPWFDNPVKPGWIVCRLTQSGRELAGSLAANPD